MSLLLKVIVLIFSTIVLTVVATIGPMKGKTGYYASNAYYTDSKCKTTPVSIQYTPLGVCMNQTYSQSFKSSSIYTSDPSNKNQIYQTTFYGSGSCNSVKPYVASYLSNYTSAISINATCIPNLYNYDGTQPYLRNQIGYVATLPALTFPQYSTTYYDVGGCAKGVINSIQYYPMYQNTYDGSYYCYPGCNYGTTLRGCSTPSGTVATGYASMISVNATMKKGAVTCASTNTANLASFQYVKFGACDPTTNQASAGSSQSWSSTMWAAYTSGSTSTLVQTQYPTTNCGGIPSFVTYYPSGYCPTTASYTNSYIFQQYSVVSTLPAAPVGGMSSFEYTTPAGCAATDPTQIVNAYYAVGGGLLNPNYTQTAKCYNPSSTPGPAQARTLCGPQTFTSTIGGFMVTKSYVDSSCATTPTGLFFFQSGVCTQYNATASAKYITTTSTTGVTVMSQAMYRNKACTGTPAITANVLNTTSICKPSTDQYGVTTWSTTTFTPVLTINSGFILGFYTSATTCTASTQTSLLFGSQVLSNTCGTFTSRNNSLVVVNACGVPTAAAALAVVYVTQAVSSPSLTLATVQSPTFQTTFKQAVATTAGVAASAVQVTGVTQSSRRNLLAAFNIAYTVATTTTAATAVTAAVTGSSSSIVGQMSTKYPGVAVATPTVVQSTPGPTAAPSVAATTAASSAPVKSAATHVLTINGWLVVSLMSMVGTVLFAM